MTERKVGPFLCEKCGIPMRTAKSKRKTDDGKWAVFGECRETCGKVWSKPIEVDYE